MAADRLCLGLEGGGTRTVALLADQRGRVRRRAAAGPLNLRLVTDHEALATLRRVRRALRPPPSAIHSIALCLAGVLTDADRGRVRRLAARVFPRVPVVVDNDLASGVAAAFGVAGDGLLVIGGTGSCVVGRRDGRVLKVGGWGHLLGDHGSGYWIAHQCLRAEMAAYDRTGRVGPGVRRVLRRCRRPDIPGLVDWVHRADKRAIAGLAQCFIGRHPAVWRAAAARFAADCLIAARRLRFRPESVVLTGGLFQHQPAFRRLAARLIRQRLPGTTVRLLGVEPAVGALRLALDSKRC